MNADLLMGLLFKKSSCLFALLFFYLGMSGCATQHKKPKTNSINQKNIPVAIIKQQNDIPVWASLKILTIINNHGNIFIRHTDEPYIGVLSNMQMIGQNPEQGEINIGQNNNTINITVDYPSDKVIGINTLINGHKKGRVDLVVFVPNGIRLNLTSTYGSINIKRLSNNVKVTTSSGKVKISGSGQANIKTTTGDIFAYLYHPSWEKASSIDSINGNIVFTFSDIQNLNLAVRSEASIQNNFKAKISSKNGINTYIHPALNNTISITNLKGQIKLVSVKNQQISPAPMENNS